MITIEVSDETALQSALRALRREWNQDEGDVVIRWAGGQSQSGGQSGQAQPPEEEPVG